MAERGEQKFDVWKFKDHKRKARVPKLLPPMYGQKSGGWGTSPRAPPASQETPPTPTTSAFLLLPRPSLPACLACLLPSSWRAACWEPVAIETRPRRMLQDPGKRDALVCSLQQALCPNPRPREHVPALPPTRSSPWRLPCPALVKTCVTPCHDIGSVSLTPLPPFSTAQKSTRLGVRSEF